MPVPTNAVWRKSSFSGDAGCVEVADVGHYILVRDSKHPSWTPLKFTRAEWAAFVEGVRDGEFDL